MDNPVQSLALDPGFAKPNSGRKMLAAVQDKVIFFEKGWFGLKQRELCQGEGTVRNIVWEGKFASWMTNQGIWIFDMNTMQKVSMIEKPEQSSENQKWRVMWIDDFNFVASFANTIRTYFIKETVSSASRIAILDSITATTEYQVELQHDFESDCEVYGIGMMDKMMI